MVRKKTRRNSILKLSSRGLLVYRVRPRGESGSGTGRVPGGTRTGGVRV
jgi:hypothetical protein